MRYRF